MKDTKEQKIQYQFQKLEYHLKRLKSLNIDENKIIEIVNNMFRTDDER